MPQAAGKKLDPSPLMQIDISKKELKSNASLLTFVGKVMSYGLRVVSSRRRPSLDNFYALNGRRQPSLVKVVWL